MTTTRERPRWARLSVLELVITGPGDFVSARCDSKTGPYCDPGVMTTSGSTRIIIEAAENGVEAVRFVGGDPVRRLGLSTLIEHALSKGMKVDAASNLVYVIEALWDILSQRGVSLKVSFYTADLHHHTELTGMERSWILARVVRKWPRRDLQRRHTLALRGRRVPRGRQRLGAASREPPEQREIETGRRRRAAFP